MKKHLLILIIILFGFILRIWRLADYPVGFTADEASHGYDAYSLLLTGKDQWGQSWPLAFRSFGDFKLPVYTYLAIPFVYLLGLNEFSVRLPGALLGTAAILATYLFTQELFKNKPIPVFKNSSANWRIEIGHLASLMLVLSPWHIQLSRGAFEANLTSFFLPIGLWAWLKGLTRNSNYWWPLSAIFLGLNLYTYHAARAFTLIVVGLLIWLTRPILAKPTTKSLKLSILLCGIFLVFILPIFMSVWNGEGSARGLDVAIFNPTDHWVSIFNQRHEAILNGSPTQVSQFMYNKITSIYQTFIRNYISYLGPDFLFFNGPNESTYGMTPGIGVLSWLELPLILIALISFVRRPTYPLGFVILLILLSILPASLTKSEGAAAGRAATMLPFIHILSASSLFLFLTTIKNHLFIKTKLVFVGFLVLLSLNFFLENYLFHAPKVQARGMPYGWETAIHTINNLHDHYQQTIISRAFSEPQIYPMFYTPIRPQIVQQIAQTEWLSYHNHVTYLDQTAEYHLLSYDFRGLTRDDLRQAFNLLIGRPEDFPPATHAIQTIYRPDYPDPSPAIMIVDPMAAGLLITYQNQILLTQSKPDSPYGLPAGFATLDQSRLENALFQLSQSTNLNISPSSCQPLPNLYPQSVHRPDHLDSFAVQVFKCQVPKQLPVTDNSTIWINIPDLARYQLLPNIPSAISNTQLL